MPFKSSAQRAFLYSQHPKIAKRFEEETPKNAKLPEHVKKMNQGGFAGDWKQSLADYMNLHFSGEKKMQHMDDGGMAGASDDMNYWDVAKDAMSTAINPFSAGGLKNSVEATAGSPALPVSAPVAPTFNPKAGLPPTPPTAPSSAPLAAPVAPTGPDPLQAYLTQQKDMLNKYGPEEQLALEQQIQKQRTGFVPNLANAGAGLADAIMQGVARAGPSNFQANLQNRQDKTQEGMRQALEHAQTGNLARMKQQMELAQMDPVSPISRLAQRSASPLLKQLGLSADEIQNMPASLIGEAQTRGLTLAEIRSRAEEAHALHEQTAEYQREMLKNTEQHQRAEEEAVKTGRQQKAVETLAGQGPIKRFTSWVTQNPAQKALQQEAVGETTTPTASAPPPTRAFASEAEVESAGLPPGTIVTINGRRARIK